jgi:hypothetical protein
MHGTQGWRFFFPYAVAVKTPTGTFLLAVLAIAAGRMLPASRAWRRSAMVGAAARQGGGTVLRMTPLLTVAGVYWVVAVNQNLNIGHRHMLPTYPALYVTCGLVGRFFAPGAPGEGCAAAALRLAGRALTVAGVGLVAWEVARAFPHFIPFFNILAGGAAQGYTHLVDSSLDWGQAQPVPYRVPFRTARRTAAPWLRGPPGLHRDTPSADCARGERVGAPSAAEIHGRPSCG